MRICRRLNNVKNSAYDKPHVITTSPRAPHRNLIRQSPAGDKPNRRKRSALSRHNERQKSSRHLSADVLLRAITHNIMLLLPNQDEG